jgi:hypothetical protein
MKWWGVIGLLLVASALVWQHDRDKAALTAQAQTDDFAALALAPRLLPHPYKELDVFDAGMSLTRDIPTRTDQRPVYMVSGRIQNHTMYQVDEVWIKIVLFDAVTQRDVDSAVVKLEDLNLAGDDTVVSFSRTIQLLPPATKWGWRYEVIQAKSDPEPPDTDFDLGIQPSK